MVDIIPVPDGIAQNAPNRRTFFDKIDSHDNRLDKIERGSIRTGSVGGAGLRFYVAGETEQTTGRIGQFTDLYWDQTLEQWVPSDDIRGLALYVPGEDAPWFMAGSVSSSQSVQIGYGETPTELFLLKADDVWLLSNDNARIHLTDSGRIEMDVAPVGGSYFMGNMAPQVGATQPVVIDPSTFEVKRSTSSLRYKQDLQDIDLDLDEFLQLKGQTFRGIDDVTKFEDQTSGGDIPEPNRYVGFIAEDLDALPSLKQFVAYDGEGRPDSIAYDRLAIPLLELARRQQTQIDELQKQLQDLNEKVDQLKNMVESIA